MSHGVYSDESPYISELENLFMRFPNAVLTLQSAYEYYGMSDYVPDKYVIATSQNAHKINNSKVDQIYITNVLLDIGKTIINTQYGTINVYDKERLLIELFRFKNRISYNYYKEIVRSYRKLALQEQLDLNKLIKYCKYFAHGDDIKQRIQEVIL